MNHTTNPLSLREAIRRTLAKADGFAYEGLEPHDYQRHADALLALLAAVSPSVVVSADRAALLREAADIVAALDPVEAALAGEHAWADAASLLRRMAAEAQQAEQPGTEAYPPRHRWSVETRDGVADEWAPGTRYLNRHHAVERYEALNQNHPTWKDGTPVERRIVRETTTHTVEGPSRVAAEEQPAETQDGIDLADRLEAALTERFTALGNPFSEMRRHEQGPDGWPASHPVGPNKVAEVLRELMADETPAERAAVADQPDTQTREAFVPPAHYRGRDGTAYCVHATPVGPDSCRHCRELAE